VKIWAIANAIVQKSPKYSCQNMHRAVDKKKKTKNKQTNKKNTVRKERENPTANRLPTKSL